MEFYLQNFVPNTLQLLYGVATKLHSNKMQNAGNVKRISQTIS